MMPRIQTPAITAGELYRALIEAEPKSEEVDRKRAVCASSVAGLRPVAADPPGWPVLRAAPKRELEPIAERNPDQYDPWDGLTFAGLWPVAYEILRRGVSRALVIDEINIQSAGFRPVA